MLEIRNLKKTYKSRAGLDHKALNGVSLRFENKGLVFILGKSGSGKSTLLNVISGLDCFDSGEILIGGKSTNDFSSKDYDSYRNTYLGFIFQEYNILNEFTVKDNISLALELQGKKADEEKIDRLLNIVGLEGLKDRKPNELSGGQKQRVAIARALIKDPEIIFADEPTGNLDSSSGEQVFDFLKELAKTKLIILVSHDRESAYKYADRIIELSDGKVILDQTRQKKHSKIFAEVCASIDESYSEEVLLKKKPSPFVETKTTLVNKNQKFEPIRSKLPDKTAWKIAMHNIGVKKGRLIVTILLIVLAISMFGFTEILAKYDMIDSTVASFKKSNIENIIVRQGEIGDYFNYFERSYNEVDKTKIDTLRKNYPDTVFNEYYPVKSISVSLSGGSYLPTNVSGVVVTSKEGIEALGYKFLGEFPDEESGDIVISDFMLFMCLSKNPELFNLEMEDFLTIFTNMEFNLDNGDERNAYALVQYIATDMIQSGKSGNEMLNYLLKLVMGVEEETDEEESSSDTKKEREELAKNTKLFGIIWEKLILSILNETNVFKASYTFNFSGVFMTGFQKYIDFLQMTEDEQKEDERAAELSHLLGNYYSIFYCSKGFLTEWYDEMIRMGSYIVDTRYFEDNTDLLTNINVSYNPTWLEKNPELALAEDEIIISDILFHDIFGGLATFETQATSTSYDPDSGKYKYLYEYTPYNDRLKVYGEERVLKVVGTFDYYESYRQNYDEDENNNVLIKSISRYMITGEDVYNETREIMLECGALYLHLPESDSDKIALLNYVCNTEPGGMLMYHYSAISDILYTMNDTIFIFQKVFKYLSYIMGAFSVLLLINFMTTSVMNKKRDIGVLRALGARGVDVSKIFLNEAFLIGTITTIFSCLGMTLMTSIVNFSLRESFMRMFKNEAVNNLSLLTLSLAPFIIIVFMSLLLVYTATIIPSQKISRMLPIDAIKKS